MTSTAPSESRLRGKRALVTAGAQGIGAAISEALLAAGCSVFVHYHSSAAPAEDLVRAATAAGRTAAAGAADLTRPDAAAELVRAAVAALGGLDILVNNAGSLVGRRSLIEADEAFWAEVMALNLDSLRRVTRAAVPALSAAAAVSGGASIVNLASLAGRKGGHSGSLAYSTAKGAVLTLTRALAAELGPSGIRVNAVAPGLILGTSFHSTHTTAESARATVAGVPLGRAGTPADVARAVAYLASEYDGFITGATLDINGGVYCA
jgi:3-oxoacyl-[acyl-carrier protein] reductase